MSGFFGDEALLDDPPVNGEEEGYQYDDDETFGDTGPLTSEHETFVTDHKIRSDIVSNDDDEDFFGRAPGDRGELLDDDDQEEEEGFFGTRGNTSSNGSQKNGSFFSLPSTPPHPGMTSSRTVGMFSSLALYDDDEQSGSNNNQGALPSHVDDDQLETMFKMAMGENYKPPPVAVTKPAASPSTPIDPLKKLLQFVPAGDHQALPKPDNIKGAYSLSDLEAKFESQTAVSPTAGEESQPTAVEEKPQDRQQQPRQDQRRGPRQLTLGDLIPGNKEYQAQQQGLREQARENNWNHHKQGGNNNNNNYSKSPNGKHNNSKQPQDKKYMSAEEIQTIHRLQAYQLHYTNPYIEDFYYQKLKQRGSTAPPIHSHTPICDSLPKSMMFTPKKPTTVDPLLGSLGRIPSHSIRAPRPILQIILDKDDNEQYDKTVQSSDQTIKLAIESSYNHLLDLEDIDALITNPSASDTTLIAEYQAKREQVSIDLFKSLHLDPFPCFKQESPVLPQQSPDQKWPSVCPDDLLFVSLWVIGKGRKLLSRAFNALTPQQAVSGLLAVCRNLPLLLLLHLPEGSEDATNIIYAIVARWVMETPVPFFILAFHFLVNFNQAQFIVKLFQSHNGLAIVEQFLMRGYYLQDPQLQIDQMTIMQYHEIYNRFFQRLAGNFASIFAPTSTSSPSTANLSKLHSLILHLSNDSQRNIVNMELNGDGGWDTDSIFYKEPSASLSASSENSSFLHESGGLLSASHGSSGNLSLSSSGKKIPLHLSQDSNSSTGSSPGLPHCPVPIHEESCDFNVMSKDAFYDHTVEMVRLDQKNNRTTTITLTSERLEGANKLTLLFYNISNECLTISQGNNSMTARLLERQSLLIDDILPAKHTGETFKLESTSDKPLDVVIVYMKEKATPTPSVPASGNNRCDRVW
eukprot:gene19919-23873_t